MSFQCINCNKYIKEGETIDQYPVLFKKQNIFACTKECFINYMFGN